MAKTKKNQSNISEEATVKSKSTPESGRTIEENENSRLSELKNLDFKKLLGC